MAEWSAHALNWIGRFGTVALVTVCATRGSAPRNAGAKMLVSAKDSWGTIGGGNLEYQVMRQARALLTDPDRKLLIQDYPLGPLLAQCCGGQVRVLLERLDSGDSHWLRETDAAITGGKRVTIQTAVSAAGRPKVVLPVDEGAARHADEADAPSARFLDGELRPLPPDAPRNKCAFLVEAFDAPPALFMFGAGHVGRAVAHVLELSRFCITWFDSRDDVFPQLQASTVRRQRLEDVERTVAQAPPNTAYLVFTHSHELDYAIVRAILLRGDFGYCGLIGSRTKRARFEKRLREDGIASDVISRLRCPIGILPASGKEPVAIAVSAAAELLQLLERSHSHGLKG